MCSLKCIFFCFVCCQLFVKFWRKRIYDHFSLLWSDKQACGVPIAEQSLRFYKSILDYCKLINLNQVIKHVTILLGWITFSKVKKEDSSLNLYCSSPSIRYSQGYLGNAYYKQYIAAYYYMYIPDSYKVRGDIYNVGKCLSIYMHYIIYPFT